ncbi:38551_t:CDS:2, partial [Gigaspora margarita]
IDVRNESSISNVSNGCWIRDILYKGVVLDSGAFHKYVLVRER